MSDSGSAAALRWASCSSWARRYLHSPGLNTEVLRRASADNLRPTSSERKKAARILTTGIDDGRPRRASALATRRNRLGPPACAPWLGASFPSKASIGRCNGGHVAIRARQAELVVQTVGSEGFELGMLPLNHPVSCARLDPINEADAFVVTSDIGRSRALSPRECENAAGFREVVLHMALSAGKHPHVVLRRGCNIDSEARQAPGQGNAGYRPLHIRPRVSIVATDRGACKDCGCQGRRSPAFRHVVSPGPQPKQLESHRVQG